jgi:hypothetical protein
MKQGMKDSIIIKKPQYSSRIIVSPNTTSNKNGPKLSYTRRGNSIEGSYRDNNFSINNQEQNMNDNDMISLNSLITQTAKGSGRPATSNQYEYVHNYQSNNNNVKYIYIYLILVHQDQIRRDLLILCHLIEV